MIHCGSTVLLSSHPNEDGSTRKWLNGAPIKPLAPNIKHTRGRRREEIFGVNFRLKVINRGSARFIF